MTREPEKHEIENKSIVFWITSFESESFSHINNIFRFSQLCVASVAAVQLPERHIKGVCADGGKRIEGVTGSQGGFIGCSADRVSFH